MGALWIALCVASREKSLENDLGAELVSHVEKVVLGSHSLWGGVVCSA